MTEPENQRPSDAARRRFGLPVLLISACVIALLMDPASSRGHEPITTRVRFNREVVRILQRSCLDCHRPGGIAPWSLVTYDEARPWAKAIKEEMLEKRMPPWHAQKGFGEFRNAPPLTQREIDIVVNWTEGGAPRGTLEMLPEETLFTEEWKLGKPDVVLKPEKPHRVAPDADETVDIVLPTGFTEDRSIQGMDLRPGDATVVYGAAFYLVSSRTPASPDGRAVNLIGTWVPGIEPVKLPEGAAIQVPAGSSILARIKYRGSGDETGDQSSLGLYLAPNPSKKRVVQLALTDPAAPIPVSETLHAVRVSKTVEVDGEAVAILPEVHPLLASLQATVRRPDGSSEVLIWVRGYQFGWRPTYYYARAVSLPRGSKVEVVAHFDNRVENRRNPNRPPKSLAWADISNDPLCVLLIAVDVPLDAPDGRRQVGPVGERVRAEK